jgi:hypothetical protein
VPFEAVVRCDLPRDSDHARPTENEFPLLRFLDLFDRQGENIDNSGRGDLQVFRDNLARWAPDGREPEIIADNSMKLDFTAVAGLRAGVRFVHIDDGHYREIVLNDLRKTEAVLCPGGLVIVCHGS